MIERGQPWGREVPEPPDALEIGSDADLAAAIAQGVTAPLLVSGGDLAMGLGARTHQSERTGRHLVREVPIDALRVRLDDREVLAVAHVLVRSRLWLRGPILLIGNASLVSGREVVRRGHPNDGRFEIVEVDRSMSARQRLVGRRRMRTGAHLAHPLVSSTQGSSLSRRFQPSMPVWVDGRAMGRVSHLDVEIVADAGTIHH